MPLPTSLHRVRQWHGCRFLGPLLLAWAGTACGDEPPGENQAFEPETQTQPLPAPRERGQRLVDSSSISRDQPSNSELVDETEAGQPESPNGAETAAGGIEGTRPCQAGEAATDSPQTIPELLQLLDSLPRPTSVPCFLQSLARPLYIYATRSQLSAQPAESERSPRTFIVMGDLTLSVVPSGRATELLEFGYRVSDERSVKGEIEFPLYRRLRSEDLVEQIQAGPGTLCGGCHTREAAAAASHFAGAFESSIIPPFSYYEIDIQTLEAQASDCNAEQEPRRCEMLGALFEHGPVYRTDLWGEPTTP